MNPNGYDQYVAIIRRRGLKPDPLLAKFAARYKFAGQLNTVEILNSSTEFNDAYLLALRLSLAYSAFESLVEVKALKGSTSLKSPVLSREFRGPRLAKYRNFLIENTSTKALKDDLSKIIKNEGNSNILPVIAATRHLMFHGIFNPTAAGARTQTARNYLDKLGQALFTEMDRHMLDYLDQFKASLRNANNS